MVETHIGSVFVRTMGGQGHDGTFRKGDIVKGHTHNFDHMTIFSGGLWRIRRWRSTVNEIGESMYSPEGEEMWQIVDEFERSTDTFFHLLIEAKCKHEFTYLGDGVGKAWCIFANRNPQGEVVEYYDGWHEAYQ